MEQDFFKGYETNQKTETTGVTITLSRGMKIKIARAGGRNREYEALLNRVLADNQAILEGPDLDLANATSDKLMAEVVGKTLIKGWPKDTMKDGKPFPYTEKNAIAVAAMHDLRAEIMMQAQRFDNFLMHQKEAEEEN